MDALGCPSLHHLPVIPLPSYQSSNLFHLSVLFAIPLRAQSLKYSLQPAPPLWLSQAVWRLQQVYPDDLFEATSAIQLFLLPPIYQLLYPLLNLHRQIRSSCITLGSNVWIALGSCTRQGRILDWQILRYIRRTGYIGKRSRGEKALRYIRRTRYIGRRSRRNQGKPCSYPAPQSLNPTSLAQCV